MSMKIIKSSEVLEVSIGHMRCDGTFNVEVSMKNGEIFDLFGIPKGSIDALEDALTKKGRSVSIDERFFTRSEALYLSQNGIRQ